jgi:hypothetical protein
MRTVMQVIRESVKPAAALVLKILFENPICLLPGEFPSKRIDKCSPFVALCRDVQTHIGMRFGLKGAGKDFTIRLISTESADKNEHTVGIMLANAAKLHGKHIDVTNASWRLMDPRTFVMEIGNEGKFVVIAHSTCDFTMDDVAWMRTQVYDAITRCLQ